jgi:hypothetical protein
VTRRIKQLAALLLAPVMLSGCGALGLSSASGSSGSSGSSASGGGSSAGGSWLVVDQGTPTPSAGPGAGANGDNWTLPWTPLGSGGRGGAATGTATPTPTCGADTFDFSRISAASAVTSTTSAVVSWYNIGGYNLQQFRVTAISQDLVDGKQRDVGWVTVTPTGCGQMSATITGLDRKTGYVFSVDAVVLRRSGDGTHAATVARSGVVRTQ